MPRTRAFAQVDVFSSVPYRGNPVAVILDAEGLTDAEMARIANWTNLSETTFVLPPTEPPAPTEPGSAAKQRRADYRLRIFTPAGELPFAGHPTLGSAAAWLASGGRPRTPGTVLQECAAGIIELRHTDDSLAFAAPPCTRTGGLSEPELEAIASALHIDRSEILAHQWVDNGPGWAAVQLASAEKVLGLHPDFSGIPDTKLGVLGFHTSAPEQSGDPEHLYEIRAFVPGEGVAEDPVTGSLNASVAQWLIGTGAVPDAYTVTQGTVLGRAGIVSISTERAASSADEASADAGTSPTVWVGGATTICFSGTAYA